MNNYQVAFKALRTMPKNFVNNHNRKYLLNKLINQKHKQVIVSIKGNSRIE